jgi:hypothetical protein
LTAGWQPHSVTPELAALLLFFDTGDGSHDLACYEDLDQLDDPGWMVGQYAGAGHPIGYRAIDTLLITKEHPLSCHN